MLEEELLECSMFLGLVIHVSRIYRVLRQPLGVQANYQSPRQGRLLLEVK